MTQQLLTRPITVKCLVCGVTNIRKTFQEEQSHYQTYTCHDCGFAFSYPRPTEVELSEFYSDGYYDGERDHLGYADYRTEGEDYMRRAWKQVRGTVNGLNIKPKRMLDIGCATGAFLASAAKDGWDCTGVDMIDEAAQIARTEYGIKVFVGDVLRLDIERGQFGLVTLWHIVEHLIDPLAVLKRVHELLAPGGYIFIEVPSWGSLGRRVRGHKWAPLKPPEHIAFFSPHSISVAAEKAGFEVIKVTTHYPGIDDQAGLKRPSQPIYKAKQLVAKIVCQMGMGGNLRLLARKK